MTTLVCIVPVCPVRAEPSHKSEQVSQLLFGELCEVVESAKDFVKIKVLYDSYEGWCQESQLDKVEENEIFLKKRSLAGDWLNEITIDEKIMRIPFGSSLPDSDYVGRHRVTYSGKVIDVEKNPLNTELLEKLAFPFLNTPYLWGGRSVFGIDCSGFTQNVFKFFNIPLLRDASQQVTQGDEVGFLQEAKAGDLAFFDNEAGRIIHVAILLHANTIIHASGKVRLDTINTQGIINTDTGKRTHKLRLIKRIVK
jgi:cell wall-associated NlpC family hydrolase